MSCTASCADPKDVYELLYSKDASKLASKVHSNALSLPISALSLRKIVSNRVTSSLRVILNSNYTFRLLSHYCQMFCNLHLTGSC